MKEITTIKNAIAKLEAGKALLSANKNIPWLIDNGGAEIGDALEEAALALGEAYEALNDLGAALGAFDKYKAMMEVCGRGVLNSQRDHVTLNMIERQLQLLEDHLDNAEEAHAE